MARQSSIESTDKFIWNLGVEAAFRVNQLFDRFCAESEDLALLDKYSHYEGVSIDGKILQAKRSHLGDLAEEMQSIEDVVGRLIGRTEGLVNIDPEINIPSPVTSDTDKDPKIITYYIDGVEQQIERA